MKTLLICHEGADMDRVALAHWLASFSELTGIVVIREPRERKLRRFRRELQRIGWFRFLDVIAFKIFYRIFLAGRDRKWETGYVDEIAKRYPALRDGLPLLEVDSPNGEAARTFIAEKSPDVLIARCKSILNEKIFSLARVGTFVLHPGVCPEYRNAHGCFWAIANGEHDKVGATLLKIDKGVDTGPVYGYFSYPYDFATESHIVIQHKVVMENLPAIETKLEEIAAGSAIRVDTAGRKSNEWGQPWLSRFLRARRMGAQGR